jgi:hypothetical protein
MGAAGKFFGENGPIAKFSWNSKPEFFNTSKKIIIKGPHIRPNAGPWAAALPALRLIRAWFK